MQMHLIAQHPPEEPFDQRMRAEPLVFRTWHHRGVQQAPQRFLVDRAAGRSALDGARPLSDQPGRPQHLEVVPAEFGYFRRIQESPEQQVTIAPQPSPELIPILADDRGVA